MNFKIIGKYIKELNFNIPNPKTFFLLSKDISNYKINIDIRSSQAKKNIIEVLTSLSLSPTKNNFETINTKIIYSTLIELEANKLSKNEMERIILVEVPNEIYSELRRIFVFMFENSGFKDVKISETVNFEEQDSSIATYAKKIISVGAKTSELEEESSNKSFQPMSNLFEQNLIIILDTLTILLMEKMGIKQDELHSRDANIE